MKKTIAIIAIIALMALPAWAGPKISKNGGGGGGGDVATDAVWDAAGDILYGTGGNTGDNLAIGTAYQLLMTNSGATAPAWTSTLGATGTRMTAGFFTDLTVTNAIAGSTTGNIANTLTSAKGDMIVASGANTPARLAHPGAANYALTTNGTDTVAWASTHSHSDSAAQFYNATNTTRLIKADASGITADSKTFTIKPITDVDVTFSPGKTFTDGKWCTYATATGLTCNQAAPAGTGDILADGSVAFTGAPIPSAANTVALGSTSAEWADIYFGDGAIIYGQNDQSATLTSGASLWTANNFSVTTQFKLPSSDADPTGTAGYIRHDNSDTDASAGGIVEWHDGTNTRRVVDGAASAAANYTVVVKTEFIPVAWMTDGAAAPSAIATYETTKYRDFADDSTKDLQFIWMTPLDLIGTTVKVRAIAMVTNATAPADEEGVSWGISAAAVGASASVDAARGTEVFSEDTDLDNDCNAKYDVCYFPYVEVTPAVTVAAGTLMAFTVNRDHDNDDDTYGQDIGLIGVEIKYKARINLVDTW